MAYQPIQIGWKVWLDDPEDEIGEVFVSEGELKVEDNPNAITDYVIYKDAFDKILEFISKEFENSKHKKYSDEWWEDIRDAVNGNLVITYHNNELREVERPVFLRGVVPFAIAKWIN